MPNRGGSGCCCGAKMKPGPTSKLPQPRSTRRVAADAKLKDEKLKCAARSPWLRRRPQPSQPELDGSRVAAEFQRRVSLQVRNGLKADVAGRATPQS